MAETQYPVMVCFKMEVAGTRRSIPERLYGNWPLDPLMVMRFYFRLVKSNGYF